ncbi:MAG: YutD family protein [Bacilli bacterium]|nr:YutD family protein [Bacilli bacterium]
MDKIVEINNIKYKIIKEHRDGYEQEAVEGLLTDYFEEYDYVFGDWAYSKLRLKGFNKSDNKKVNQINDIANLEDYIKNNCAYDCKYFLLEKEDEK